MTFQLEESKGAVFLHPFDDLHLIAGYGSLGYEICQQVPDVSVVIVCCGGGGKVYEFVLASFTVLKYCT